MFYPNCCCINSLAPGRSYCDFKNVIFNLALLIGIFKSSYVNVIRWMPQQFTDDKLTLVQVMAWCCQATSHYLKQSWSRSPTPYASLGPNELSHRGWDKFFTILQTTFSNAFSWTKMCEFHLRFDWSLFLRVELTIFQHWFAWSAPSHYLKQWWLVNWCIYASLGLNELTHEQLEILNTVATDILALNSLVQNQIW